MRLSRPERRSGSSSRKLLTHFMKLLDLAADREPTLMMVEADPISSTAAFRAMQAGGALSESSATSAVQVPTIL